MFERFTGPARAVVVGAQAQARELGHAEIRAEHLLLAVSAGDDPVAAASLREAGVEHDALRRVVAAPPDADAEALRSLGIDLDAVRRRAEATFGPGALDRPRWRRVGFLRRRWVRAHEGPANGHIPFTGPAKEALESSLREALALRHHHIGVEHLLLGLLAGGRTPAATALRVAGADPEDVRTRVRRHLARAA